MILNVIAEVLRDDSGTAAIQYGIVVSVAVAAAILTLSTVGESMNAVFERVNSELRAAMG